MRDRNPTQRSKRRSCTIARRLVRLPAFVVMTALISACSIDSLPGVPAARAPEPMQSIRVGGDAREFLLHVPDVEVPDAGWPLVIVLHSLGANAAEIRERTGFDELAEDGGFIAVYPEGTSGVWIDAGIGTALVHTDVAARNLAFISALIENLNAKYGLDQQRTYLAGYSNGGMFAFHVACHLSDRIAVAGLVASASVSQSYDSCDPGDAVSYIAFHGTSDRVVPYDGGRVVPGIGRFGEFQSAHDAAGFWAQINGCAAIPTSEVLLAGSTGDEALAVRESWGPCQSGGAVELVTLNGGGHTWPGGATSHQRHEATNLDIDASGMLWEFFAANPKPGAP